MKNENQNTHPHESVGPVAAVAALMTSREAGRAGDAPSRPPQEETSSHPLRDETIRLKQRLKQQIEKEKVQQMELKRELMELKEKNRLLQQKLQRKLAQRQSPTPETFLNQGLAMTKRFPPWGFFYCNPCSFTRAFGGDQWECKMIWDIVNPLVTIHPEVRPEHLLWALLICARSRSESLLASRVVLVDSSTFHTWSWRFIYAISSLTVQQVSIFSYPVTLILHCHLIFQILIAAMQWNINDRFGNMYQLDYARRSSGLLPRVKLSVGTLQYYIEDVLSHHASDGNNGDNDKEGEGGEKEEEEEEEEEEDDDDGPPPHPPPVKAHLKFLIVRDLLTSKVVHLSKPWIENSNQPAGDLAQFKEQIEPSLLKHELVYRLESFTDDYGYQRFVTGDDFTSKERERCYNMVWSNYVMNVSDLRTRYYIVDPESHDHVLRVYLFLQNIRLDKKAKNTKLNDLYYFIRKYPERSVYWASFCL